MNATTNASKKIPEKNLSYFKRMLADRHPNYTLTTSLDGSRTFAYAAGKLVGEITPSSIRVAAKGGDLKATTRDDESTLGMGDISLAELLASAFLSMAGATSGGDAESWDPEPCYCALCTAEREAVKFFAAVKDAPQPDAAQPSDDKPKRAEAEAETSLVAANLPTKLTGRGITEFLCQATNGCAKDLDVDRELQALKLVAPDGHSVLRVLTERGRVYRDALLGLELPEAKTSWGY